MSHPTPDSINFYVSQLVQFIGQKITRIVTSPPDEWNDQYFGLQIGGRDGKILWFLQDDEGNGPGSFDITDLKKIKT